MRVVIETIPHREQRYDTCGDWQFVDGDLLIRVSELGNWRMEMLVARHELDEALLCRARGIDQQWVDDFDQRHPDLDEPGEDPAAPYHCEHMIAYAAELTLMSQIGVDFEEYRDRLAAL
jgi:hypothetical protein